LVGPSDLIAQVGKIAINTVYHAPTPSMHAGLRALTHGAAWVADAAAQYAETGAACARVLGVPAPAGSTFLFLDVSDALARRARSPSDGRSPGLAGLLEALADEGVLVAPGPSFGPYPHHIRLCFTAVDPGRTLRGVHKVAALLGR
jgi:N-succinyldiaminopimelate aminotransferase